MTPSLRDSLAQVQELLGRATPGELTVTWMENANTRWPVATDSRRQLTVEAYSRRKDDDTRAIAAAVNFLRTHGPELMKVLDRHGAGDAEDAARWRFFSAAFDRPMEREWLRRGFGLHPDDFTPSITVVVDAARAGERGVS